MDRLYDELLSKLHFTELVGNRAGLVIHKIVNSKLDVTYEGSISECYAFLLGFQACLGKLRIVMGVGV